MQFYSTSFAALVAACLSLTSASPAPIPQTGTTGAPPWVLTKVANQTVSKRTIGGIELCTDANWSGDCGFAVQPLDECIHLTSPFLDSISSFGPDPGFGCDLYSDTNCENLIFQDIVNPGCADLTNCNGQNINDRVGSFLCFT